MNDRKIWGVLIAIVGILCIVGSLNLEKNNNLSVGQDYFIYWGAVFIFLGIVSFFWDNFSIWLDKIFPTEPRDKSKKPDIIVRILVWWIKAKAESDRLVEYKKNKSALPATLPLSNDKKSDASLARTRPRGSPKRNFGKTKKRKHR
jgi:hypothetical protein